MLDKEIFKIMWLPEEMEIIFHAKDESPLSREAALYKQLSRYFDIEEWKRKYSVAYMEWLRDESSAVCDIGNEVNQSIIRALIQLNQELDAQQLYYWFDIDRTLAEGFTWEYCPISGEKVIYLGDRYRKINAFASPSYPLIFPDYEQLFLLAEEDINDEG